MDMAAPQGVATRYFSFRRPFDVIHKAAARQHIFLIVENPEDALRLVKGGVPIKKLNIGNMHMSEGKRQVANLLFAVNDEDVQAFRDLQAAGVELFIQRVPSTPKENVEKLFE
jgi:PTS system N-acetylgalactosamine-specific IIB component